MDIGRFVDSAAIRAYLKEQNYPFSAQEAAFLVYHCKTASLEEQVRAWEEIIRTMPNCSLEKTRCREEIPDFHAFLRRCSALLRRQARQFQQTDGCVFSYEDASFSEKAYRAESGLFSTYDRCRDACVQEMREEGWDRARIRKHKPDKTEFGCGDVCCLNPAGEVLCCDIYGQAGEAYEPLSALADMWLEFPTPFHAGDLVYAPTGGVWKPFVLTDISTWDSRRIRQELPSTAYSEGWLAYRDKQLARCRMQGCGDAVAGGYTTGLSPDSSIPYLFHDEFPFCNYWELEFYPKPLSGSQRLLQPVINYLRRDSSIELLVNSYSVLLQKIIWEAQLDALQYVYAGGVLPACGLPEADADK